MVKKQRKIRRNESLRAKRNRELGISCDHAFRQDYLESIDPDNSWPGYDNRGEESVSYLCQSCINKLYKYCDFPF